MMKTMWDGMALLGALALGLVWVVRVVEANGEVFGHEGPRGEHCPPPPHAPPYVSPPPSSPPPPPPKSKKPPPTLPPPPSPVPIYTPPPPPYLPPTPPPPPYPVTKPPPQTCSPAELVKIQVCTPLLSGLNLGVVIGGGVSPAQKSQCCALLDLLGPDAEVCLCAAIDVKALGLVGVHAKIDLVLKVFTACGRTAPPKLKACPK